MKTKKNEEEELLSFNSELSEFDLQQLEQRLETDPLAVGGLLDIASSNDLSHSVNLMEECECNKCGILSHNN